MASNEPVAAAAAPTMGLREGLNWQPGMPLRLRLAGPRHDVLVARMLAVNGELIELSLQISPHEAARVIAGGLARVGRPGQVALPGLLLHVSSTEPVRTIVCLIGRVVPERRQHERYLPVEPLPASVRVAREEGTVTIPAVVTDVSSGGIGLLAEQRFTGHEQLAIHLRGSDADAPLDLEARVVWTGSTASFHVCGAAFTTDPGLRLDPLIRRALATEVQLANAAGRYQDR